MKSALRIGILLVACLFTTGKLRADLVLNITFGTANQIANSVEIPILLEFTNNLPTDMVKINSFEFNLDAATSDEFEANSYARVTQVINLVPLNDWQAFLSPGHISINTANTDLIEPSYNAPIGKLFLDVSNLPSGNYTVAFNDGFVQGLDPADVPVSLPDPMFGPPNAISLNPSITFSITAVPEPSSIALIAIVGCCGCFVRSREKES